MAAEINIYNPAELGPPMGQYTHVTRVRASEFLFIAGMLSGDAAGHRDRRGRLRRSDRAGLFHISRPRCDRAGASWANVVQFTTYLVHSQDIPKFMAFPGCANSQRCFRTAISAEHPSDGRPAGQGSFSGRGAEPVRRRLSARPRRSFCPRGRIRNRRSLTKRVSLSSACHCKRGEECYFSWVGARRNAGTAGVLRYRACKVLRVGDRIAE